MSLNKVGFIGTGVMGAPMAKHLSKAGYEVHVYNRTHSKAKALEPECIAHDSLDTWLEEMDVVFTIVGYPKDVEEVMTTISKLCSDKTILVDMTTSSPTLAKKLDDTLPQVILDSPVTGGDLGAINGTLSIMVGGDESAYDSILPLLECMGTTITYMGASGNGQHAKLANQTAIAGSLAGIAESLNYARMHGLDLEKMLAVITGGSANSWQGANNGPKMIQQDFAPGFYAKHFLKDLNLVLEEKAPLSLPVVESVQKIFTLLCEEGYEDLGTQVIYKYYE